MVRAYGNGSVSFHARTGLWTAQVSSGSYCNRVRRTRRYRTEDEARAACKLMLETGEFPPNGIRKVRKLAPLAPSRKYLRIRDIVPWVLAEGRRARWSDRKLGLVMEAQLAKARRMHRIFGPCVYCGTWIAGHVDHVIPLAKGGTDDPKNLVSACGPCNLSKGDRLLDEWRAA